MLATALPGTRTEPRFDPVPDVSVIVPVRDGAEDIRALLECLDRQTLARDRFEIVIGDDGSTDGGTDGIATADGHVRVAAGPPQNSYATRNRAVATDGGYARVDGDGTGNTATATNDSRAYISSDGSGNTATATNGGDAQIYGGGTNSATASGEGGLPAPRSLAPDS